MGIPQLTPQIVVKSCRILNSSEMAFLRTCKNEERPVKHEGARMLPKSNIDFSDAVVKSA